MGIVLENRFDAPRPATKVTPHGAEYVEAATETPVAVEPEESVEPVPEPAVAEPEKPAEPQEKRKVSRAKKSKK